MPEIINPWMVTYETLNACNFPAFPKLILHPLLAMCMSGIVRKKIFTVNAMQLPHLQI